MTETKDFEERYQTGDLPWDTGERDRNLEQIIGEYGIRPCSVLELGAGTGSDAVWLVKQGFRVTAIDVSPTAIDMARKKAEESGVSIEFINADLKKNNIPSGPFDFVFDRGCFHSFKLPEEKADLTEIIWKCLKPDGYWFSIMGSTDGPPRESGPPRLSALDVAAAVESRFEILSLKSIHMDTNLPKAPRAWACLMRIREINP